MTNKFIRDKLIKKINEIVYSNLIDNQLHHSFFIKHRVIPIEITGNSIFCVGLVKDSNMVSNIEYLTKKTCKFEIIDKDLFECLLNEYSYKLSLNKDKSNLSLFEVGVDDDDKNIKTVEYLNRLIAYAISKSASDIHIEPFKDKIRIRIRIDGHLYNHGFLNNELHSIIITRIKIIGMLDIAERRIPQDGRITFSYENRDIDLRISTLPTIFGEKIAIRILDSKFEFNSLESIGLDGEELTLVEDEISKLCGMILVCGPTGSGKTTTIYSILNQINSEEINITSLEDPVEYKIDGINQVQINYKTGLEFINTLNHILRQDPDVISIGEMRDKETVRTALRAAITGHFVTSTLHTNDCISAISRLKDMGGESYLISNALKLIISQRLIRKLCPHCKEKCIVDSILFDGKRIIFKAVGCSLCNKGYLGRMAVFELLKINDEIKWLIENRASYEEILISARNAGYKTLEEKLIEAVIKGHTSLEEVVKFF